MVKRFRPLDDKGVLNYFFDDRCTFVVDFDEGLIDVEVDIGSVRFKLKNKEK